MGTYSELAFNDAVTSFNSKSTLEGLKVIEPLQNHNRPLPLLEIKKTASLINNPYLPPREYCDFYISRFFEDIHCVFWLFPFNQFHSRLDDTYRTNNAVTISWLCCLYSIFALGASSFGGKPRSNIIVGKDMDTKSSLDYLTLAKSFVGLVCDEANIDSIRALAILSLALHSSGFKLTSVS